MHFLAKDAGSFLKIKPENISVKQRRMCHLPLRIQQLNGILGSEQCKATWTHGPVQSFDPQPASTIRTGFDELYCQTIG